MTDTINAPSGANDLPYHPDGNPAFDRMSGAQLEQARQMIAAGTLSRRPVAPQPNQFTPRATAPRPSDIQGSALGYTTSVNDKSSKTEVRVGGPKGPGVLGSAVDKSHRFGVTVGPDTDPASVLVKAPMGGREVEMTLAQAVELGLVSRASDGWIDHTNMAQIQQANSQPACMQFSPVLRRAAGELAQLTAGAGIQGFSTKLIAALTTGDKATAQNLALELEQKTGVKREVLGRISARIAEEVFAVIRGTAARQGLDPESTLASAMGHEKFTNALREAVNGGSIEGIHYIINDIRRSGSAVLRTGLTGQKNPDGSVYVGGLGVTTSADLARRLGVAS